MALPVQTSPEYVFSVINLRNGYMVTNRWFEKYISIFLLYIKYNLENKKQYSKFVACRGYLWYSSVWKLNERLQFYCTQLYIYVDWILLDIVTEMLILFIITHILS